MTQQETAPTGALHQAPPTDKNTVVLRIPKPSMKVAVLGLVALITVFQTIQLTRISAKSGSATTKAAPAASTGSSGTAGTSGTGSADNVPQSMVGGC